MPEFVWHFKGGKAHLSIVLGVTDERMVHALFLGIASLLMEPCLSLTFRTSQHIYLMFHQAALPTLQPGH